MNEKTDPFAPIDDTTQLIPGEELKDKIRMAEKIPTLIVIEGSDQGKIFKLTSSVMTIGRGSGANIRLNDKTVSRKHCIIENSPGKNIIIDLESSNGTFVNQVKIQKHLLQNGDKVRIGNTLFKFEITDFDENEFHEKIYHLITFDDLTSLYNRKYLYDHLQFLFKTRKKDLPFTLIFIDLDCFKKVNDTYGHVTGNELLSEFGRLLLANTRTSDIACRYGGEEFIVILHNTTGMQAINVAEKIRKLIKNYKFKTSGGKAIKVTVSIGIAEIHDEIKTPNQLISLSDKAMYKAKKKGRNKSVLYQRNTDPHFIIVTPEEMEGDTSLSGLQYP